MVHEFVWICTLFLCCIDKHRKIRFHRVLNYNAIFFFCIHILRFLGRKIYKNVANCISHSPHDFIRRRKSNIEKKNQFQ